MDALWDLAGCYCQVQLDVYGCTGLGFAVHTLPMDKLKYSCNIEEGKKKSQSPMELYKMGWED